MKKKTFLNRAQHTSISYTLCKNVCIHTGTWGYFFYHLFYYYFGLEICSEFSYARVLQNTSTKTIQIINDTRVSRGPREDSMYNNIVLTYVAPPKLLLLS